MEAIENDADIGMICAPYDFPGVPVIVDVAAPGERLVAHPQLPSRCALAQFAQIFRRAVDAAKGKGRHAGANQHQVGAQLAHQVELSLCPFERLSALRLRQSLEISERLEQRDGQPQIGDHRCHVARCPVKGKEVVLKNLDAVKTRRSNSLKLLPQVAADRYRGDRSLQNPSSPTYQAIVRTS